VAEAHLRLRFLVLGWQQEMVPLEFRFRPSQIMLMHAAGWFSKQLPRLRKHTQGKDQLSQQQVG
jgi:hypothetical protein